MKLAANAGLLGLLVLLLFASWLQFSHLILSNKLDSGTGKSVKEGFESLRRKLAKSNPNYNVVDLDFDSHLFLNPSKLSPRQGSKVDQFYPKKLYRHVMNNYVNQTKKHDKVETDEAKLRARYPNFKFNPKPPINDPNDISTDRPTTSVPSYFDKDLNFSFVRGMTETSFYNLLDLVLVLSKKDDFELTLSNWQIELKAYHLIIIVEDGTDLKDFNFPSWLDYEAHTCESIRSRLGINAWVVGDKEGGTGNGIGLNSFGAWVSTKDYVFVIDPRSRPYNSSHTNLPFIQEHLYNLITPSFAKYFDAAHDPWRPHENFPKGAPYYLRRGHYTAVSQGMHVNDHSYDAITQQLKFSDSQAMGYGNVPDKSRTVPTGSLFSMSMTNIMYRSEYIGPAMLVFNPNPNKLYKVALEQPGPKVYKMFNFSEYIGASEIIAGWMTKRTLDWTHTGAKMGPPFVEKASSKKYEFEQLLQEIKSWNGSSEWHLDAYNYFQFFDVNKNPKLDRNPVCPLGYQIEIPLICFVSEIQHFMGRKLGAKYPFFKFYYDLAFSYFQVWYARKSFFSDLVPISVQRSRGPADENSTCALITIVHNEKDLLPVWLRYYRRHINVRDMYVFDHMTTDGSLDPSKLPEGINILKFDNKWIMPVLARSQLVQRYQDYFIRQGYKCVLFSDTDELIVPDPKYYPGGLREYLHKFIANEDLKYIRVNAYELGHMSWGNGTKESQEPPIDWSKSLLKQRKYYIKDHTYNKPLLVKVPLPYRPGFHRLWGISIKVETDPQLVMFHIRSLDYQWCHDRAYLKQELIFKMDPIELATGYASHWNKLEYDKKNGYFCRYAIACFVKGRDKIIRPYDNLGLEKMETLEDYWADVEV